MLSLVTFLHQTRTWDNEADRWVVDTPVARLLAEIEALAQVHGLSLSRWQSSKAKWIVKITYALHYGARTVHFRHLYDPVCSVVLHNREGKSQRCEAYRKLSTLLSYLQSLGEPNMKILVSRDYAFPSSGYGQNLHFDDGSSEWDAFASQTTDILTAEQYNGRAAKDDSGVWVPAPGARIHEYVERLLGFVVGLTYLTTEDGHDIYDYSVTTPTKVTFHGNGKDNVARVLCGWSLDRVVADVIAWICLGEDTIDTFPADTTPEQWQWIRSNARQEASIAIDEWIEQFDQSNR